MPLVPKVPCADPSGDRTASLIMRYSVYLLPIPVAAAALGATSWMFAVEGTALNAWILYKAHRFGEDRSKANARGVFRASLWHLPAVLALYVFHSRRWLREDLLGDEEEQGFALATLIQRTRTRLKEACVHEVLQNDDRASLCPAVVAEDAADKAQRVAVAVQADETAV